jgi:hypothetical protein
VLLVALRIRVSFIEFCVRVLYIYVQFPGHFS